MPTKDKGLYPHTTTVNSTAYESSHVLKGSEGQLTFLNVYNSKASAQFIQIFNSATLPADASVPVLVISVPATTSVQIRFNEEGMKLGTGIVVANSSTGPTKTIGSADCYFTASVT